MSLVDSLYKLARTANTGSALGSGKPDRIARRAKNIVLGRALSRGGIWRKLWGGR